MVIKTILLLADGFEEVEAVTLIDVLRRGSISVVLAKVGGGEGLVVKGAHEISLTADVHLLDIVPLIDEFAALLLPGGGQAAQTFCTVRFTLPLSRFTVSK